MFPIYKLLNAIHYGNHDKRRRWRVAEQVEDLAHELGLKILQKEVETTTQNNGAAISMLMAEMAASGHLDQSKIGWLGNAKCGKTDRFPEEYSDGRTTRFEYTAQLEQPSIFVSLTIQT